MDNEPIAAQANEQNSPFNRDKPPENPRLTANGKVPYGRKDVALREKLFLEALPRCHNVAEAYLAAGYGSKTHTAALKNGCALLSRLKKKASHTEIMDMVGLNDSYLASKILEIVDSPKPGISVKGLNLATRCKGWQGSNLNVGIGMQIVITDQSGMQDRAIDVTAISTKRDDKPEQIKE